jgi:hypothetical protein
MSIERYEDARASAVALRDRINVLRALTAFHGAGSGSVDVTSAAAATTTQQQ